MGLGGSLAALYDQSRPPESAFSVDQIPDLGGKVVIVTGGNTGVGKETVKALLNHNAKVYLAARSKEKALGAIKDLKEETGKEALFLQLDLSDLHSIKSAVGDFLSKESRLHILFNNAGVMVPPIEQLTADGYDLQFGTNCLGHFYFTKLLLSTLLQTANEAPDKKVRVISTSSSVHMFHPLKFDTFKDGPARKSLGKQMLYAQSKYGNVVFALELHRRYGDQGITSIAVNPGNLKTELQRHSSTCVSRYLNNVLLFPAPMGALTQLWGGTMPETAEYGGKYLIPWARLGKARPDAEDPETGKKLWEWLEDQVKFV